MKHRGSPLNYSPRVLFRNISDHASVLLVTSVWKQILEVERSDINPTSLHSSHESQVSDLNILNVSSPKKKIEILIYIL